MEPLAMCIAVPMQVVELDSAGQTARVELSGNRLTVDVSLVNPGVGDYVLVHAGCALQVVAKDAAREILDLFSDLEELAADGNR